MTSQTGTTPRREPSAFLQPKGKPILDLAHLGNRIIDLIMGIRPDEVLNPEPPIDPTENPAKALMQATRAMQAAAIDSQTGRVDYGSLEESQEFAQFRRLIRSLPLYTPADLGTPEGQIAFWVNLYNALMMHAILHYGIGRSIRQHLGVFRRAAYNVAGMRFSLDDIEHGVLRGNRRNPVLPFPPFGNGDPRRTMVVDSPDPRIHFALVCGARSCPPISYYHESNLEQQLDIAASGFINSSHVRFVPDSGKLLLSKIFQWYESDFGGRSGILRLINRHRTDTQANQTLASNHLKIEYLPYDWNLNSV